MALTEQEKVVLTLYLTSHGIVDYIYPSGSENRLSNVLTWLDTIPNLHDYKDENPLTGIKQLFYCLSFTEKHNIFSYKTANDWYVDILNLIKTEVITDNVSKAYIDKFTQRMTNMRMLAVNFTEFLLAFLFIENTAPLTEAFYIMEKQGLIGEGKINKMQIELSELKRYQSLGLSALPTESELEGIIGL